MTRNGSHIRERRHRRCAEGRLKSLLRERRKGPGGRVPILRIHAARIMPGGHRYINQRMVIAIDAQTTWHRLCVTSSQTGWKSATADCVRNDVIDAGLQITNLIRALSLLSDDILIVLRAVLIGGYIHRRKSIGGIIQ